MWIGIAIGAAVWLIAGALLALAVGRTICVADDRRLHELI